MQLGIHCSVRRGLSKALDQAAAMGCPTLQMFSRPPHEWKTFTLSDADAEAFRQKRVQLGLDPIVVHTPYLPNLSTANPVLYARSVRALKDDLDICHRIRADYFVIHPGAYSEGETRRDGILRFAEAMSEALSMTSGVMVLLENMAGGGRRLGARFEELAEMRTAVSDPSRIGFCLDTAHTLAAGYPLSTAEEVETTLTLFDQSIGWKHLKVVHANDSSAPLGAQRDWHEHIGKGHIGEQGFRALVRHPALKDLPFILETPRNDEQDDLVNMATLKSYASQA